MIADFHHEIAENYALLGYYVVSSGNFWMTFWDKLSVSSSELSNPKRKLVPTDRRATWGQRLAQVDVHLSVKPFLHLAHRRFSKRHLKLGLCLH